MTKLSVSFGFYGKIPARGDFVRSGLPRGFIDAWDGWLQHVVAGSRQLLAETWLAAWMEAPVWRFYLAAGVCGRGPAAGVFMPSVDRAGRHFPLTLACVGAAGAPLALSSGWLGAAEAAGIAAIAGDLGPDALASRLPPPDADGSPWPAADDVCSWSTDGAPRVAAAAFTTAGLPDAPLFARMLQDTGAPGG